MYRLASVILVALLLPGLAACSATSGTATVEAECRVFTDPGFPVQGKRVKDQRWIARTQEKGITVCGWPRPEAEPPEAVVTVEPAPTT